MMMCLEDSKLALVYARVGKGEPVLADIGTSENPTGIGRFEKMHIYCSDGMITSLFRDNEHAYRLCKSVNK